MNEPQRKPFVYVVVCAAGIAWAAGFADNLALGILCEAPGASANLKLQFKRLV